MHSIQLPHYSPAAQRKPSGKTPLTGNPISVSHERAMGSAIKTTEVSTNSLTANFLELRYSEVQHSPAPIGPGRRRGDAHIVGYYAPDQRVKSRGLRAIGPGYYVVLSRILQMDFRESPERELRHNGVLRSSAKGGSANFTPKNGHLALDNWPHEDGL
jgi:hypothetical protein